MRVRYFGSPWPSPEQRAPICDDDRWQVPTPVGQRCLWCHKKILAGDRGVIMASGQGLPYGFELELELDRADGMSSGGFLPDTVTGPWLVYVCACHIDCHVAHGVGRKLAVQVLEQAGLTTEHLRV